MDNNRKIALGEFQFGLPENWQEQAMITLTLPSADKNIRPNVIVTKEYLPQETSLEDYYAKVKESIEKRGVESFTVHEEDDIELDGLPAKMIVCSWDLSAMKRMMGAEGEKQLPHVKEGQVVKQVQVSSVYGPVAINVTASFPDDQFEVYFQPFQDFIQSFEFKA